MDSRSRKKKMKIVFFGNHTVGVKTLETLSKKSKILGIVCHPLDPEDGKRYLSVYNYALSNGFNVIRGAPKDKKVFNFIKGLKPDLIWVTDYRYILPVEILSEASIASVNLHPSLLPKYRGRASLNWAILNGEKEVGLTAHLIDENVDSGDILAQVKIYIGKKIGIGEVLKKLLPVYKNITIKVISMFDSKFIKKIPQNNSLASIYPARKPHDGLICWTDSSEKINNLIRSVTHPYPGAFSKIKKAHIYIWKSIPSKFDTNCNFAPGTIIKCFENNEFVVKCGKGKLKITDWTSLPTNLFKPEVGIKFEK